MRILVTGGAGFIGSHLTDALLERGDDVVVLDNLSTGHLDNVSPSAEFVEGDIADETTVAKAVAGCEVVYHQAALGSVARSVEKPLHSDDANIHGTLAVLQGAHLAGARRVVMASSSSVYGGAKQVPTPESVPLMPRSPYAVTKLTGEHYARVFHELHGLETVCLRYFNVFGPRQRPDSQYAAVIPLFIDALLTGRRPSVHGDGLQSRDFTFVADAVQANLKAGSSPAEQCSGRAFNIARGAPSSLLDLLGILAAEVGVTVTPEHTDPRAGDIRHSHADITAARRDLGYDPAVSFPDGLARTLDWFRDLCAGTGVSGDDQPGDADGPNDTDAPAVTDQAAEETQETAAMTDASTSPAAAGPETAAPAPGDAGPGPWSAQDDLAAGLLSRIHDRTARVLIVGQGYVGLPVSMRAVEVGFPVVGLEASPERAAALQAGSSYVADVPDEQLRRALDSGYRPVADPADTGPFDIAVITVPTPLRDGAPDLSYVEDAAATLARRLRAGALVVLESTTYPGTTDELMRPILEQSGLKGGDEFFVGYSPERIDPGNARWGFVNTPKVVSGIDDASRRCVEAFYGALVDKVVPVGSTAEAELVKLLENTFRHVNIALVNELAMFADSLGINIWGAIDAASSKPFGYMRFTPGPGVGGHCLPIDPSYLSWRVKRRLGQTFRFVELANDVNEHMPDYVVTRAMTLLNRHQRALNGSRVLVLGLSYKAGTSDWRESPSIAVVERLLAMGADVRACEPYLPEAGGPALPAPVVECTDEEVAAADLVVLLVDHPDFPLDDIARHARLLLDTKGVMRPREFSGETL